MDWSSYLDPGENIAWEGRPAPRCFTFRHWKTYLFGLLLLLLSVYWIMVGVQIEAVYAVPLISWIPFFLLIYALYLSLGRFILSRLEWEKVFYAVTDRRVLSVRGILRPRFESLFLKDMTHFDLQPFGKELSSIHISAADRPRSISFHCIEHPGLVVVRLESALTATHRLVSADAHVKAFDNTSPH